MIFLEKSSTFSVRKTRSISPLKGRAARPIKPISIQQVPHLVNVLQNLVRHCTGVILAHTVVLTVAPCVKKNSSTYSILSASSNLQHGIHHPIKEIIRHPQHNSYLHHYSIALIIIEKAFNFINSPNRPIKIDRGKVPAGTPATLNGWGMVR